MYLKYPHIENIENIVKSMLDMPVSIEEKIDGANFSILHNVKTNSLEYRSRNQLVNRDESSIFREAILLADILTPLILEQCSKNKYNSCYYFEFFGKGIQKRINYQKYIDKSNTLNDKSLILIDKCFDVGNAEHTRPIYSNVEELDAIAKSLNVCRPIWTQEQLTLELVNKLLNTEFIEGYVIKTRPRVYNVFGQPIMGKLKTNWYINNDKSCRKLNEVRAPKLIDAQLFEILQREVSLDRINSIYSHGHTELKKHMADMQYLPQLICNDIMEEFPNIKPSIKDIAKLVVPKLKEWLLINVYTN